MATAQCTYAIIHMYMYARRREADHTRCQRTYVLVLSLATPRTQAHSPKGGRLQCMYADASEYVHVVTYTTLFIRRSNQHGFAMQRACIAAHCTTTHGRGASEFLQCSLGGTSESKTFHSRVRSRIGLYKLD